MKKLTVSILAAGLAALTLASCGGGAEETSGSSGAATTPAGSASTTTTVSTELTTIPETTTGTPETTAVPDVTTGEPDTTTAAEPDVTTAEPDTTTATPDPSTPDPTGGETNNLYYAIDLDMTIVDGNIGIVFSGLDTGNFLMWQIAIGEYEDGNLYFRPHYWSNNSPDCFEEIVLNEQEGLENISVAYNEKYHMTIRVFNDGSIETLINNVSVHNTDWISDLVLTDDLGMIGFRCDAYHNATVPEIGLFDNLKITDGTGAVIYEDDFSDMSSILCTDLVDGTQAVVENGALKITGKYLRMTYVN